MEVGAVFNIQGRTVVTGTVATGVVRAKDRVEIAGGAQKRSAVVQRVESFNKILTEGRAGQNIGLALDGVDKSDVQPGCVITGVAQQSKATAPAATPAVRDQTNREDPRFRRVEGEYARKKADMDAGRITPEQLDQIVNDLIFQIDGRYWMIGANSGTWYASSGDEWVSATPPGR
jgi:translation elongation factor EF-Tu-like GTPase